MKLDKSEKSPVLPPTYFFLALAVTVAIHFLWPLTQVIAWPYRWFGLLPLAFGGWITVWADQIFKRVETTVKPHLDPTALVAEGPFRISRHPMYLGMTLILFGVALLLGSVTAFIPAVAFCLVMQLVYIPMEEAAMLAVFGEDYRQYRSRVRCWI